MNLGVVLTVWDVLAGMARFPARGSVPCPTGLAGRPVPVEQAGGPSAAGAPDGAPAGSSRFRAAEARRPVAVSRPAGSRRPQATRASACAGPETERARPKDQSRSSARSSTPERSTPKRLGVSGAGDDRPSTRTMHGVGHPPRQRYRLDDVEAVDDAVRQRAGHPAARRLPLVQRRGAEVGEERGDGSARRRGPPRCSESRVKSPPAASSSAMNAGPA